MDNRFVSVQRVTLTRVVVLEGVGDVAHRALREVTYLVDDDGHVVARVDPLRPIPVSDATT